MMFLKTGKIAGHCDLARLALPTVTGEYCATEHAISIKLDDWTKDKINKKQ